MILVVGVNGTGKTTTIGKLAFRLAELGKTPLMVAADTFRAAAVEQLSEWASRVGCEIVRQAPGSDPAAVVYDGIAAARSRGAAVVIVDTAGRLHTQVNLMNELAKVRRVIEKQIPGAPHETLLVIDATTGQNGLRQAQVFAESVEVTGVVLTKLDGSAKGGIVIAIREELGIPIKLIGVGERLEDLRPFDPDEFARALFLDDAPAGSVRLRLDTPRLIVRDYTAADLDDVAEILADPEVFWWVKEPFTRERARLWLDEEIGSRGRDGTGRRAVVLRQSSEGDRRRRSCVARPRHRPRDRAGLPPAPRLLGAGLRHRGRRRLPRARPRRSDSSAW